MQSKGETSVKRLAYLTTDEVNEATAVLMAEGRDAIVVPFQPKDSPRYAECDAVLYDLDVLSADDSRKLLRDLLTGPAQKPVALHSFNLDEGVRRDLRDRGVTVFRRLKPDAVDSWW